jgi:hypothetical protein
VRRGLGAAAAQGPAAWLLTPALRRAGPSLRATCCRTSATPVNRLPLTVDMLQPDVALKARIDAWIAQQRAKRRAGGA